MPYLNYRGRVRSIVWCCFTLQKRSDLLALGVSHFSVVASTEDCCSGCRDLTAQLLKKLVVFRDGSAPKTCAWKGGEFLKEKKAAIVGALDRIPDRHSILEKKKEFLEKKKEFEDRSMLCSRSTAGTTNGCIISNILLSSAAYIRSYFCFLEVFSAAILMFCGPIWCFELASRRDSAGGGSALRFINRTKDLVDEKRNSLLEKKKELEDRSKLCSSWHDNWLHHF